MDAGLQIKALASIIGVTQETVINWELRGMMPMRKDERGRIEMFLRINCTTKYIVGIQIILILSFISISAHEEREKHPICSLVFVFLY